MKIIIYGLGKQAELLHYLFTNDSPDEVVAFCVDAKYLPADNRSFLGLPVVDFEHLTTTYPTTDYVLYIAVGQNNARQRLYEAAKARGYSFASYISTRAQVWPDTVMGDHVFIDQNSGMHPFVTLGSNVILIDSHIGHHATIGSHTLLSCALVGAACTVGDNTFVGIGTIINPGVAVGPNNLIGSGCLITKSTAANAVFSAAPSKPSAVDANRVTLFKRQTEQ